MKDPRLRTSRRSKTSDEWPVARRVSETPAWLGEGARWDASRDELLWVDILGRQVRRSAIDTTSGLLLDIATYDVGMVVGAAAPVAAGGGWVLAAGQGIAHLAEDGTVSLLADCEPPSARTRMNDAACDPVGRFVAGSMATDGARQAGSLYSIDLDGGLSVLRRQVTSSNGLGWAPGGRTLYYVDSGRRVLEAISYDPSTGTLGESVPIVRFGDDDGIPDGLVVDEEGAVWIAMWGAGEVRRYHASGRLMSRVIVPVRRPSSVCIGGVTGRTLFITSAAGHSLVEAEVEPDAGHVFAVEVDVGAPPVHAYGGPVEVARRR